MIYTITLNPSIDYVVHTENLQLGELNHIKKEIKLPGGKGINVSRILHRLGKDNAALGFIGGFTGSFIAEWLRKEGLDEEFIRIGADTRINIKLKSSEETEINDRGPAITPSESARLLNQLDRLTDQDIVILSGSKPPSLPDSYYDSLIEIITHKQARFAIDTTGEALHSALRFRPLVIKPNLNELGQLFNKRITHKDEIIHYGKELLDNGAYNVIVSMAGDGALLFTKEGIYKGSAPAGNVKNSVGAGDSMLAGFIGEFAETKDPLQAFRMAIASGSATAFSDDLAEQDHILSLLGQIEVQKIS